MIARNDSSSADRELVSSRVFDAPRERVWTAWTEARHIAQWWGPRGFRTTVQELQLKPGGDWRLIIHGPDGTDYPNHSVFVEVSRPERLVFDHVSAPQFRMTATFEALGEKTRVTVRMVFATAELRDRTVKTFGAAEGLRQNLEKLDEYFRDGTGGTSSPEPRTTVTRLFDAPRERVFELWSAPEHLKRWWGPAGFTLPVCEVDFRVGGQYRMAMRGPDGNDYPFQGEYREIRAPERIVFSAIIHGSPDHEMLTTVLFTDEGGKTRVTVHQTKPAHPDHARGQFQGWSESLEKLAAALAR